MHGKFSRHRNRIRLVQSSSRSNFRNDNLMNATLQFFNRAGKVVVIRREFSDKKHLDNFINYATRRFGYSLDEVWY